MLWAVAREAKDTEKAVGDGKQAKVYDVRKWHHHRPLAHAHNKHRALIVSNK